MATRNFPSVLRKIHYHFLIILLLSVQLLQLGESVVKSRGGTWDQTPAPTFKELKNGVLEPIEFQPNGEVSLISVVYDILAKNGINTYTNKEAPLLRNHEGNFVYKPIGSSSKMGKVESDVVKNWIEKLDGVADVNGWLESEKSKPYVEKIFVGTQSDLNNTLSNGDYVPLSEPGILFKQSAHPHPTSSGKPFYQLFVRPKDFESCDDAVLYAEPLEPQVVSGVSQLMELVYAHEGVDYRIALPATPRWLRFIIDTANRQYHLMSKKVEDVLPVNKQIRNSLLVTGLVWKFGGSDGSLRVLHYKAEPYSEPALVHCKPDAPLNDHQMVELMYQKENGSATYRRIMPATIAEILSKITADEAEPFHLLGGTKEDAVPVAIAQIKANLLAKLVWIPGPSNSLRRLLHYRKDPLGEAEPDPVHVSTDLSKFVIFSEDGGETTVPHDEVAELMLRSADTLYCVKEMGGATPTNG